MLDKRETPMVQRPQVPKAKSFSGGQTLMYPKIMAMTRTKI